MRLKILRGVLVDIQSLSDKIARIYSKRNISWIGKYNEFSVVILLHYVNGEPCILYEVRSEHMDRQPGETCLPGGERDEGETAEECAFRELYEETGISQENTELITEMDNLVTYAGIILHPYIVRYTGSESDFSKELILNPNEVKHTFSVPISFLERATPKIYDMGVRIDKTKDFPYREVKMNPDYSWRTGNVKVPVINYKDEVIWGLTARITLHFIRTLQGEKMPDV